MIDQVLQLLGQMVAYGGSGAAIAYLVFKFLGKGWIDSKFAQRLEQFKHQQVLELQRLRIEIDSMLSGSLRIQEKEFQVLPEAWQKLDEAFGQVSNFVSPMQGYPNLDRLNTDQLEEFLATSQLYESQKNEIRGSSCKVNTYQEIIFWHRIFKVKSACADMQNYVVRNGIFFPKEIKDDFAKISKSLWAALIDKEVGHEAKDYKVQNEGWKKIKDEIEPLYQSIEIAIHARLHSHAAER